MRKHFINSLVVLVGCALTAQAGENWTQFRGDRAAGVADGQNLPDTWSTTENVAWIVDIPGHGWSCPVVWGDRVFLTSFVSDASVAKPDSGFYRPADVKAPEGTHRWTVYCLNAKTGEK